MFKYFLKIKKKLIQEVGEILGLSVMYELDTSTQHCFPECSIIITWCTYYLVYFKRNYFILKTIITSRARFIEVTVMRFNLRSLRQPFMFVFKKQLFSGVRNRTRYGLMTIGYSRYTIRVITVCNRKIKAFNTINGCWDYWVFIGLNIQFRRGQFSNCICIVYNFLN